MMTQTTTEGHHPDLILENYNFDLPTELIAQRPCENRDRSRMLFYDQELDKYEEKAFFNLVDLLPENSVLVLNQSAVFPCRLIGKKGTGGKAEVFLLTVVKDNNGFYKSLIKMSSKKKIGDKIYFDSDLVGTIEEINPDATFQMSFNCPDIVSALNDSGLIPIPPYIRNGISDETDTEDYQTVFAKDLGSVAAPTAGLHFTPELLEKIEAKGIKIAKVTLHVGLGTFLPVKSELITEHDMHFESFQVSKENLDLLNSGREVYAVGTTSLRVLETIYTEGLFKAVPDTFYETNIFLHPGKKIKSIAGIITNFHLPKSSLLMLVSTLIGREKVLELYNYAIKNKFRFFSYGDAMLIKRKLEN